MKEKIKRLNMRRIFLAMLVVVAVRFSFLAFKLYFERIDAKAKEIQKMTDLAYETKKNEENSMGFYVVDLKEELTEFVKERNITSLTYEFEGESFYFDILVSKNEEGEYAFEIEKIANPEFGIYARTNMKNVQSIEYRSAYMNESAVIKINQDYNSDYFAMTEGAYYFLGQDIEAISYKNEHFYYLTFNPKYTLLEEAEECSKDVTSKISGFKLTDYYYKYGKINFLTEYYQKLGMSNFTVQNKCDELAASKADVD